MFIPLVSVAKSGIAGLYGKPIFIFGETASFPTAVPRFTFLPAMNENSCGFTSLAASGAVSVLDFGYFSRCTVVEMKKF